VVVADYVMELSCPCQLCWVTLRLLGALHNIMGKYPSTWGEVSDRILPKEIFLR